MWNALTVTAGAENSTFYFAQPTAAHGNIVNIARQYGQYRVQTMTIHYVPYASMTTNGTVTLGVITYPEAMIWAINFTDAQRLNALNNSNGTVGYPVHQKFSRTLTQSELHPVTEQWYDIDENVFNYDDQSGQISEMRRTNPFVIFAHLSAANGTYGGLLYVDAVYEFRNFRLYSLDTTNPDA